MSKFILEDDGEDEFARPAQFDRPTAGRMMLSADDADERDPETGLSKSDAKWARELRRKGERAEQERRAAYDASAESTASKFNLLAGSVYAKFNAPTTRRLGDGLDE